MNLFDPGTLEYNTTYYWKVVTFDSYEDSQATASLPALAMVLERLVGYI